MVQKLQSFIFLNLKLFPFPAQFIKLQHFKYIAFDLSLLRLNKNVYRVYIGSFYFMKHKLLKQQFIAKLSMIMVSLSFLSINSLT